jgi:hypothetical protein
MVKRRVIRGSIPNPDTMAAGLSQFLSTPNVSITKNMRQVRSKAYRKLMAMYSTSFGFRQPYQVLGAFCHLPKFFPPACLLTGNH